MRITYKHILILIVGYLVYYIFQNIKLVNIPIKKKLTEKVVTSNRDGEPYYYYRWQLENGEVEFNKEYFEFSSNYELGKTYIFYEQKIEFK